MISSLLKKKQKKNLFSSDQKPGGHSGDNLKSINSCFQNKREKNEGKNGHGFNGVVWMCCLYAGIRIINLAEGSASSQVRHSVQIHRLFFPLLTRDPSAQMLSFTWMQFPWMMVRCSVSLSTNMSCFFFAVSRFAASCAMPYLCGV